MVNSSFLRIDQVTKSFGEPGSEKCVLSNVNLDVSPKEFVCLLGPSGCGKSTLLNTIAGFTKPNSGRITINDQIVKKPGPDRGFVFQKNSLLPWMTLEQNVGYGLKIKGFPKSEIREKVDHFLDLVGLSSHRLSYPHQLSGCMQQR